MWNNDLDSRVFLYIKLLLKNHKNVSVRSIAKWVWYEHSIRTVHLSIHRLFTEKKIIRNSSWQIELSNTKIEMRKIPLVYDINKNGSLLIGDYFRISTKIVSEYYDYFLFRFNWDSMSKLSIKSWDLLLIRQTKTAAAGDVVLVIVDNNVVLRELRIKDEKIALVPHSIYTEYEEIIVNKSMIIVWVFVTNLGKI